MSKLSDRGRRHDEFHRRARQGGFVARSVFKLSEIDDKHRVMRPGARVLDLGCKPGSWLQYCIDKKASALVGLDREGLKVEIPRTRIVIGDVLEIDPIELLGDLERFDLVLSDMAPDTSGVRHVDQTRSEVLFERALWMAEQTLSPGGNFVAKLFQGPEFQVLIKRCRKAFGHVKMVKPKGSRSESIEQYVVCRGYGETKADRSDAADAAKTKSSKPRKSPKPSKHR